MAPVLAHRETPSDYVAYKNIISTFCPGYELSFGSSVAMVGRLGWRTTAIYRIVILHYHII